jgi:uncharacterized membrane protein
LIFDGSVEIEAPARIVWDVFSDVERWSEWTASIQRIVVLDGRELAVGRRFAIKQPWMPELVWEVTALQPGASWTWVQRSPGAATSALHEVEPRGERRTLVRQRLEQSGALGVVVAFLMSPLTRRYLELEAQGL